MAVRFGSAYLDSLGDFRQTVDLSVEFGWVDRFEFPRSTSCSPDLGRWSIKSIDLRWHDLRHEGACRLLADGVDIRIIQLMLGHASIQQTQRYLNVTDEEMRRGLEVSWKNEGRPLRLASGS